MSTLIAIHLDFCHWGMEIEHFRIGRKLRDHLVLPSRWTEKDSEVQRGEGTYLRSQEMFWLSWKQVSRFPVLCSFLSSYLPLKKSDTEGQGANANLHILLETVLRQNLWRSESGFLQIFRSFLNGQLRSRTSSFILLSPIPLSLKHY